MELKQVIADNVSSLRRDAGMTQAELAEKLNYTDKAVSKWERGESCPDITVLKTIAELFGVTVDYLITREHIVEVGNAPLAELEEPDKEKESEESVPRKKPNSIKSLFAMIGRK